MSEEPARGQGSSPARVGEAAREDGLISVNPAEKLGRFVKTEKPKHKAATLTAAEAQRLLDTTKETYAFQEYLLLMTALRRASVAGNW